MEPRKERFSIRKFTIGAASVLIGFTLFGMASGQSVKADTIDTAKQTETVKTPTSDTSMDVKSNTENQNGEVQTQSNSVENQESTKNELQKVDVSNQNTVDTKSTQKVNTAESTNSKDLKQSEVKIPKQESQDSKVVKNNIESTANATGTTSKENNSKDENNIKSAATTNKAPAVKQTDKSSIKSRDISVPKELSAQNENQTGQSENVTDSASFLNALRNGNTSIINLTSDVDFTGYTENTDIDGANARAVTIDLGSHTLNLADKNLNFNYNNKN